MTYEEWNGHVINDVTWPWKVEVILLYVWSPLSRQRLRIYRLDSLRIQTTSRLTWL